MHFKFKKIDGYWTLAVCNGNTQEKTIIVFDETVNTNNIIETALLLGKGDISTTEVDFTGASHNE